MNDAYTVASRGGKHIQNKNDSSSSLKRRKINPENEAGGIQQICLQKNQSTLIPSILHFLERVFTKRWCVEDDELRNSNASVSDDGHINYNAGENSNIVQHSEKKDHNEYDIKVLQSHKHSNSTAIFNVWKNHLQQHERIIENQNCDFIGTSPPLQNTQRSQKETVSNIFPILDSTCTYTDRRSEQHQYQSHHTHCNHYICSYKYDAMGMYANSHEEEWVICVTFVLAYKCLFNQVEKITSTTNNCDDKSYKTLEDDTTTKSNIINHKEKIITHDVIITKALRLLLLLHKQTQRPRASELNEKNHCKEADLLEYCFPNHWSKLISFIRSVHDSLIVKGSRIEETAMEQTAKEMQGNETLISNIEEEEKEVKGTIDLDTEEHLTREAIFDRLLDEIHKATSKQKRGAQSNVVCDGKEVIQNVERAENNTNPDEANTSQNLLDKVGNLRPTKTNEQISQPSTLSVVQSELKGQKSVLGKDLEKAILDLRLEFFAIGENTASNIINEITKKMLDLLHSAGQGHGALGIKELATILKYGRSDKLPMTNSEEEDVDPDPSKNDDDRSTISHFPDLFVSSFCKAVITQETSAVRASMIMSEFVLPSIIHLKVSNSRSASRLLISTLSFLANDRPAECASSLLVPSLCQPANVSDHGSNAPNKAQCELVSKIVKQGKLPKRVLGSIVADLTTSMEWNEQTVQVLTTCLQKKPQLSDETVELVTKKICTSLMPDEGSTDNKDEPQSSMQTMRKGMKFSTLFHIFVTRHGKQINDPSTVKKLLDAAGLLKTILGKSISSSLKKL